MTSKLIFPGLSFYNWCKHPDTHYKLLVILYSIKTRLQFMKNKKFSISIFSPIIIILLLLGSCKKDQPIVDADTTAAIDCYVGENYFSDVKNIVDEVGFRNGAYTGILSDSCVTIQFDTLNNLNPDTITIDFGSISCNCPDGRMRKGKIITTYSGHYNDTSMLHKITFNNYFVDGNRVSGTIKDFYKGYNAAGHMYFKDSVAGVILYTTGKSLYWNSTHTLEFISGDSTATWNDNIMSINGTASGYSSDALAFSSMISSPLIRNFETGCRKNLIQGVIQVAVYGKSYRSEDLGNGTCDASVTISIDGKTYPVIIN